MSVVNAARMSDTLMDDIEAVCARIAPTWPLDRFIAVNPWWGWIDHDFDVMAGRLARANGVNAYPDRSWLADAWRAGRIDDDALRAACTDSTDGPASPSAWRDRLDADSALLEGWPLLSDCLDARRDLRHRPAWTETITQQISQFCARWFDGAQADWHPGGSAGLYATWRATLAADHGTALLMGDATLGRRAAALPDDPLTLIADTLDRLSVAEVQRQDLLLTVLLRINGWASWCAYKRWQARLAGDDDSQIVDLMAIRLAWEHLLDDGYAGPDGLRAEWRARWAQARQATVSRPVEAVGLDALERSYRTWLAGALARPQAVDPAPDTAVQAVFCIDVRSEVFRRNLEAISPAVSTLGFAGFFGLPIEYTPLGSDTPQPLAPGLVAPALTATETTGESSRDAEIAEQRLQTRRDAAGWAVFKRAPASAFTLVETLGLGYFSRLVRQSLFRPARRDGETATSDLRPRLAGAAGTEPTTRIEHAERVLRSMSLTRHFAPIVLLVGHASRSHNNPHASGLDCGACCGASGEVNARALAALLNDPAVRDGLAARGIVVPEQTRFVPALHETTTDRVTLHDVDDVPARRAEFDRLKDWLARAGARTRAERAPALGLAHLVERPDALADALEERARDWAQTRPEWGLADNAAFIAAPRRRTRGLDLGGRAFLHEYEPAEDASGEVLGQILSAPMIVAHWINLQYYASTVDHTRYGSGNKVLHNVVGAGIGVFEGNGGDLRIGLARQTIHDGTHFRHTPQRLTVAVEAPRERLAAVIDAQPVVAQLVHNRWVHLLRIEPDGAGVEAYTPDGAWRAIG